MESGPGFALLSTMVSQFAGRGISTVFEGIEEGWQLDLAERSGASMVQGYVLARPELAPTSFAVFRSGRPEGAAILASEPSAHAGEGSDGHGPSTARPKPQPARTFGRRRSFEA